MCNYCQPKDDDWNYEMWWDAVNSMEEETEGEEE
jgi:hypothetical protein